MDWFSWLSRTNLEPSLVYEYSLSFSHNELEHEDITFFNHEFLQSMGISIAKHRLEILKLVRRHRKSSQISRFMIVIKKTGKCFSHYLRAWIRRDESSRALMVVPPRSMSTWRGTMMKRNKRWVTKSKGNGGVGSHGNGSLKQERLLLTNGTPCRLNSFSSPMVYDYDFKEEKEYAFEDLEGIKWDSMFQNLKPT